jgi:hypothetical protein
MLACEDWIEHGFATIPDRMGHSHWSHKNRHVNDRIMDLIEILRASTLTSAYSREGYQITDLIVIWAKLD